MTTDQAHPVRPRAHTASVLARWMRRNDVRWFPVHWFGRPSWFMPSQRGWRHD